MSDISKGNDPIGQIGVECFHATTNHGREDMAAGGKSRLSNTSSHNCTPAARDPVPPEIDVAGQINVYSPDQARAAAYIVALSGIGGGDDPVGFLIASHAALVARPVAARDAALEEAALLADELKLNRLRVSFAAGHACELLAARIRALKASRAALAGGAT